MRYDLFFPLDSQVVRIFSPNTCLTAFRVLTCVTHGWILVQTEASRPVAFLKMLADIVPMHYISYPTEEVCLGLAGK